MGHPAGVKRDRVKLEQRRLKGARLLKRGVPEAEVARRVGVHRQSVNRWARQLEENGPAALKRAPRAGRAGETHGRRSPAHRAGLEARPGGPGVWHQPLDGLAGGGSDPTGVRREVFHGARLAAAARLGLDPAAAGGTGLGTERAGP